MKNCRNCTLNIETCDLCELGFNYIANERICLQNGRCVLGQYQDKDLKCLTCSSSCSHCFGPSPDDCYQCASGYYFNATRCVKCGETCAQCRNDKDYCESCSSGLVLRGQDCITECDTDEYFDEIERKCKNCDRLCGRCEKSSTRCLECRDGYHFFYDRETYSCKPRCSPGTYVLLNQLQIEDYERQFNFVFFEDQNKTSITGKKIMCV